MESREETRNSNSFVFTKGSDAAFEAIIQSKLNEGQNPWWLIREGSNGQLTLTFYINNRLRGPVHCRLAYDAVKEEWRTLELNENPSTLTNSNALNSKTACTKLRQFLTTVSLTRHVDGHNQVGFSEDYLVLPTPSQRSIIFDGFNASVILFDRIKAELESLPSRKVTIQEKKFEDWLKNHAEGLGINLKDISSPEQINPSDEVIENLKAHQAQYLECQSIFKALTKPTEQLLNKVKDIAYDTSHRQYQIAFARKEYAEIFAKKLQYQGIQSICEEGIAKIGLDQYLKLDPTIYNPIHNRIQKFELERSLPGTTPSSFDGNGNCNYTFPTQQAAAVFVGFLQAKLNIQSKLEKENPKTVSLTKEDHKKLQDYWMGVQLACFNEKPDQKKGFGRTKPTTPLDAKGITYFARQLWWELPKDIKDELKIARYQQQKGPKTNNSPSMGMAWDYSDLDNRKSALEKAFSPKLSS